MNLSKQNVKVVSMIIAILFAIIGCFFLLSCSLPLNDGVGPGGYNIFWDCMAYAANIDSGIVTDWHCPLFIYEGIAIKTVAAFFGVELKGIECVNVMAIIAVTLQMIGVAYLSVIGVKKNIWCVFLPVLVLLIPRFNGSYHNWGLDHFFMCILYFLLANIVALYQARRKSVKIIISCIIIIVLWHCFAYRRNSLLMVPIVLLSVCYSFEKFKLLSIRKLFTIGLGLSGAFFVFFGILLNFIMPSMKSYPLSPMLLSDMRIAHILNGTTEDFFDSPYIVRRSDKDCNGATDYEIGAGTQEFHNKSTCGICKINHTGIGIMHSSSTYDLYYSNLKKMPKEIVIAKLIQIIQFYRLDYFMQPLKSYVESSYPSVSNDFRVSWAQTYNTKDFFKIWMTFIIMLITLLTSLRKIIKRRVECCYYDSFYVLICFLSIAYAVSYILITPTTDIRYLMPSLNLTQIALLVWFCRWGKSYIK